jgi:putative ABC transport system permease protein
VNTIADRLALAQPRALGGVRVQLVSLRDAVVGDARSAILVLSVAVVLVLVLASANVMNLLLARNSMRSIELAVRRALGAPRSRIVRLAFAESAVLTMAGGTIGLGLAALVVQLLRRDVLPALPRLDAVRLDGLTLVFAGGLMALLAAAAAVVPALGASDAITVHTRGGTGRTALRRSLRLLTVSQLAISIVLLVGAALLTRSLHALMTTDLGIRAEGVATASLNLSMGRSLTDQQQRDLVDRVLARVSRVPGVTAVGVGTARPPNVSRVRLTLGRSEAGRPPYQAQGIAATPGYVTALGVHLERGRFIAETDGLSSPPVAVMSSDTARRLFGDEDPLGRTFRLPVLRDGKTVSEDVTVVGLTRPVKYGGLDRAADDAVYRPFAQQAWRSVFLVARTTADPAVLAGYLEREIAAVDRGIVVSDVASLDRVLADATAEPRFRAVLLAALAVAAVLVATVGLYAVVTYSVTQRTIELGIRAALGADFGRIVLMVMGESLVLVALGGFVGLAASLGFARVVEGLLYGVAPWDPASYALAATAVAACGLIASVIPAARAARLDPLRALQRE